MALELFEFPDGSRYELDLSNPEHKRWMEQHAASMSKPAEGASSALGRGVGMAARSTVKGLTAIPGVLADAATGIYNTAADAVGSKGFRFKTTNAALTDILDRFGVGKPQTSGEQILSDALEGATGGASGARLAEKGASVVSGTAKKLLEQLAQRNLLQAVSGATGAGAASSVRESGGGPGAQVTAGLLGGIAPALASSTSQIAARGAKNFVQHTTEAGRKQAAGRLFNEAAGSRAQDVIDALENPRVLVPGSFPTAGQAATSANAPVFVALQDQLAKKGVGPNIYSAIDEAQEAARRGAIRSVGGTQKELEFAEKLREVMAKYQYGAVADDLVTPDAKFRALASRPSMEKVLRRAADIAKEKGREFKIGKDEAAKIVDSMIVDESGRPAFSSVIHGTTAKYPVESLQYLKMAMDDLIKDPATFGIGATEAGAIGGTQRQLVEWLSRQSPKWAEARNTYATLSKPINQMQIGQYLENKLVSPLQAERAGLFAQAVRDAPGTVKRATGQPRFDTIEEALKPSQVQSIRGVEADLLRDEAFRRQAQAGTKAAGDILGDYMKGPDRLGILERAVVVGQYILHRIQGGASKKTLEYMTTQMQDPKFVAELMKNATPQEKIILTEHLKQLGQGGLSGLLQSTAQSREP